jgi:hypothetical protein
MTKATEIHLVQRPTDGRIGAHLFDTIECQLPELKDGEVLIQQTHMSLDPAMIGWMHEDKESYIPPVALNSVMRSLGVGKVIESKHPNFVKGDILQGMMGWRDYLVSNGEGLNKVDASIPPDMVLSVFALPGLTATQGLFNIGKPKSGETIVISGAAGSVGSFVGQLAKAEGLTVIGVAGSDEKTQWLVDELGFDAAINYKSDDLSSKLA